MTIFGHFGGHEKFFWWSSKSYETQLHAKNQKKISNGQGCRTGTHERTHGRTHESEFIGSLSDKSGEPKKGKQARNAEVSRRRPNNKKKNIKIAATNLKALKIIINK